MARILAISSFVAHGHVGLNAAVPALNAMRHEVVSVPTVILSNHYGYDLVAGGPLDTDAFEALLRGLYGNGWLDTIDAVMTGYLPGVAFAEIVAAAVERISERNPDVFYLCDPVLGDDPDGLYVEEALAAGVRDILVPIADIITPNRFELEWLTGLPVTNPAEATEAADTLGEGLITVATSVPVDEAVIANVLVSDDGGGYAATRRRLDVPHGTGDLFAALLIGHLLDDRTQEEAVAAATAGVRTVVEASLGAEELRLIPELERAVAAGQPFLEAP